MRRYRGLFRPLGAFTRAQFSADYTISMFGFNLRQGQAADVEAILPKVHTLNQIIEAKKRWGVSVIALIVRLGRLGVLSEWQYRTFTIQATENGYRKAEPFGMRQELSTVWQKVLIALWNERVTKDEIANQLHIPVEEIENLLFGLTGTHVEENAMTLRPPLRLV
jgi:hypothetical protein